MKRCACWEAFWRRGVNCAADWRDLGIIRLKQWLSPCALGLAAPGNSLDLQTLWLHQTLRVGPNHLDLTSPPGDPGESHWAGVWEDQHGGGGESASWNSPLWPRVWGLKALSGFLTRCSVILQADSMRLEYRQSRKHFSKNFMFSIFPKKHQSSHHGKYQKLAGHFMFYPPNQTF